MCVGLLKGPCCLLVHSKVDGRETQVLKMLYKGNMEQISRRGQQEKSAKVYNSSSAEEKMRAVKRAKKATPLMHCPQCDGQYPYWGYRAHTKR